MVECYLCGGEMNEATFGGVFVKCEDCGLFTTIHSVKYHAKKEGGI